MTALGSVFPAGLAPGVQVWPTALDVSYVRGALRRTGWTFVHLVGADVVTADDFHDAIAEVLAFPAYYGRNLDALNDCLGDVAERAAGNLVLWWDDWEVLASAEPLVFRRVVALLGEWLCLVLRGMPQAPSWP